MSSEPSSHMIDKMFDLEQDLIELESRIQLIRSQMITHIPSKPTNPEQEKKASPLTPVIPENPIVLTETVTIHQTRILRAVNNWIKLLSSIHIYTEEGKFIKQDTLSRMINFIQYIQTKTNKITLLVILSSISQWATLIDLLSPVSHEGKEIRLMLIDSIHVAPLLFIQPAHPDEQFADE